MKRTKMEDRVNAKRKKKSDPKKLPPRFHKSHATPMRSPTPFELPEDKCSRLGHREYTLAMSAHKKIIVCERLCGFFKVYARAKW